jgi:AraC family transcriptional regulator
MESRGGSGGPPILIYNTAMASMPDTPQSRTPRILTGSEIVPAANQVFAVRETHGRAHRPGNRLIAHSPDAGWRSLYAVMMEEAPFEATEPAIHHPSFIYHISRPTQVTRRIEGAEKQSALIGPRCLTLTPGDPSVYWAHSGRPEMLQVYLRRSMFTGAMEEMFGVDASRADLVPRFAILDPLLEQLALAVISALRSGEGGDGLYIDTLSQMIAVHLARTYSTWSKTVNVKAQVVSSWKMRRLREFIEYNLDKDLSLAAMAAEVLISPLYLPRAFKAAFGQSPHQYVLARRIERAKELLRDTEMPVVDVSLATGFSSQSHLSNWFLRTVGVPPAAYRCRNLKTENEIPKED